MKFGSRFALTALVVATIGCSSDDGSPARTTNENNPDGNTMGNDVNGGNMTPGAAGTTTGVPGVGVGDPPTTDPNTGMDGMLGGAGSGSGPVGGDPTTPPVSTVDLEGTEPLVSQTGWVNGTGNTLEIQGAFYTFSDENDGGSSTILPEDYAMAAPNEICASGEGALVPDMESFGSHWGAGIGFNLSQIPMDDTAYPYDAASHGVQGISFRITGTAVPVTLRFKAVVEGQDGANYCTAVVSGANNVRFAELYDECWLGSTGETPDLTQLTALQWQVVTNDVTATPFDFCIEDLFVITE
jgi:hypothetical protein